MAAPAEDEEESIVFVQLSGLPAEDEQFLQNFHGKSSLLKSSESPEVMLLLGKYVFKGELQETPHTNMFFRQDVEDKMSSSYVCKTTKKMNLHRVYLKKRQIGEEEVLEGTPASKTSRGSEETADSEQVDIHTEVVEQSNEIVEQSTEIVEQSTEVVEQSTEIVEQSTEVVEQSTQEDNMGQSVVEKTDNLLVPSSDIHPSSCVDLTERVEEVSNQAEQREDYEETSGGDSRENTGVHLEGVECSDNNSGRLMDHPSHLVDTTVSGSPYRSRPDVADGREASS